MINMNNRERFLNGAYAIEVENGRLNTSCPEVENTTSNDNITFTKTVGGKGYVSASCIKKNMKDFMKLCGYNISQYVKDNKKIRVEAHPYVNLNEDVFGFMKAEKVELTQEEYDNLDDQQQKLYTKKGKIYSNNVTKKRDGKFKSNGLIGLGTNKVKKEWGVCSTTGDSMPYVLQKYADVMQGLFNFEIDRVGKFIVSENETKLRDYTESEVEILGISNELSREERLNRIEVTLRALQSLKLQSNQSNDLVDTMPKIIILGEYAWGNNMFQGIITKDGINIVALKEKLDNKLNESFRLSKIWIGIDSSLRSINIDKEQLKQELEGYDVEITTVGEAFDNYIDYVKETLV